MLLIKCLYLCLLLQFWKVDATKVEDMVKIKTATDLFESELFSDTGNTGDVTATATHLHPPGPDQQLCDMYFTAKQFFYCNRCLPANMPDSCNFLIRTADKKKFRLIMRVEGGPKPFELKVMDGLASKFNKVDKFITERADYVFESTGDMMQIRLDGRRAHMNKLQFGFLVEILPETVTEEHGCSFVYTAQKSISPPHTSVAPVDNGECYWKFKLKDDANPTMILPGCPLDNTENCYLNYIRIFDGEGISKTRKDNEDKLTTTRYDFTQKVFSLEYYGCPIEDRIQIRVSS